MDYLNPTPSDAEVADAIEVAGAKAIAELFATYPDHTFYYVSLITAGGALRPFISAWSYEHLRAHTRRTGQSEADLKWSYADSPLCCFGDDHFDNVAELFLKRPTMDSGSTFWSLEYAARLGAMECAMQRLDRRGLFGSGEARARIYVGVEVMPPDFSNVERALRLNPRAALLDWLAEAAEFEDSP